MATAPGNNSPENKEYHTSTRMMACWQGRPRNTTKEYEQACKEQRTVPLKVPHTKLSTIHTSNRTRRNRRAPASPAAPSAATRNGEATAGQIPQALSAVLLYPRLADKSLGIRVGYILQHDKGSKMA